MPTEKSRHERPTDPAGRRRVTPPSDEEGAPQVRAADDTERTRIWQEWVDEFGPEEASRRWLAIFAATDAPRTG